MVHGCCPENVAEVAAEAKVDAVDEVVEVEGAVLNVGQRRHVFGLHAMLMKNSAERLPNGFQSLPG